MTPLELIPTTTVTPLPMVLPATEEDADQIARLLERLAPETLPVPAPVIRRNIARFRVIREGGRVVAAAALKPLGRTRVELRSVAVDPDCGGRGLGTLLVTTLQREARWDGCRLQCVTLNPGFFERLGFDRIPLEEVPPKPARAEHPTPRPRIAMQWDPAAAAVEDELETISSWVA